ncbi:MAG: NADH-quinone oxidoreductase subunit NuoE [Bifidobacteriaceae bacterium]|jgi:NADH-quinone oxidoreductase subunit E|nr:NADH-quinone oxidoreductase subunit NuoE [Bifidobacteriaceae bacterium]
MSYDTGTRQSLERDAAQVVARYPKPRSAILPLLHLVQSVDGFVSPDGIEFVADTLGMTTSEVSAVATFYTQFKRQPNGTYNLGVCTTALCAIMGGDAIYERLREYLGIEDGQTTGDGMFTLERIECNAACDYAPVMMANWEFFDNQTPESAVALVDALRAGKPVAPTRGPDKLPTFKENERVLAGFPDGKADQGASAGESSVRGAELADEKGWAAPPYPAGGAAAPKGTKGEERK